MSVGGYCRVPGCLVSSCLPFVSLHVSYLWVVLEISERDKVAWRSSYSLCTAARVIKLSMAASPSRGELTGAKSEDSLEGRLAGS